MAKIRIRWIQFLSLPAEWEGEFRICLEGFDADEIFVKSADDSADIYVVAYPASAHHELERSGRLRTLIDGLPEAHSARVVLIACDRAARPKVTEKMVSAFLNKHPAGTLGQSHGYRIVQKNQLGSTIASVLEISLRAVGSWREYSLHDHSVSADQSFQIIEDWTAFQ